MRNNFKDTWLLTKANFINIYGLVSPKQLIALDKSKIIKLSFMGFAVLILTLTMYNYYFEIATLIYRIQGEEGLDIIIYLSILTVFITTIFLCLYRGTGFLFYFKDYNMVLSLPVNIISIFLSRIILLYVSVLVSNIIFGLPGLLVFASFVNSNIFYYIYILLIFMLFPVIPLMVGCIGTFLITKVSSKFKNISYIITAGSILTIIFITSITVFVQNMMINQEIYYLEKIKSIMTLYFPGLFFVNAITDKSLTWFLLAIVTNIGILTIFIYLFASNFKKLNGIIIEARKSSNYKLTELIVSPPIKALYKKELKQYLSSSTYMLNTIGGMIFLIVFSIFAPFFLDNNIDDKLLINIVFGFTSICVAIACTTNVSISLEGKSFYLLKVLPIKFQSIILAKVLLNLTVTLPLIIISCIILSISINIGFTNFILILLSLSLLSLLISLNGIVVNLFFPKLNFKSEIEVIKQSTSAIISLIINLFIFTVFNFIYFIFSIEAVIVSVVILCGLYSILINKIGASLFNDI